MLFENMNKNERKYWVESKKKLEALIANQFVSIWSHKLAQPMEAKLNADMNPFAIIGLNGLSKRKSTILRHFAFVSHQVTLEYL